MDDVEKHKAMPIANRRRKSPQFNRRLKRIDGENELETRLPGDAEELLTDLVECVRKYGDTRSYVLKTLQGHSVTIESEAARLISRVYWHNEDGIRKLRQVAEGMLNKTRVPALGLETLANIFPEDFAGVGALMIPEMNNAGNLITRVDDTRILTEIMLDEARIAEAVMQQHGIVGTVSAPKLVIGKGHLRRVWSLRERAWIPDPEALESEDADAAAIAWKAGDEGFSEVKPAKLAKALNIDRSAVLATARTTLAVVDAYLATMPGHNRGPALDTDGSARSLAVVRASIAQFEATVQAWSPEGDTASVEAAADNVRTSVVGLVKLSAEEAAKKFGSMMMYGTAMAVFVLVYWLLVRAGYQPLNMQPEDYVRLIYVRSGVDV